MIPRPCLGPVPGTPCPYGATTRGTRCPPCTTARAGDRATLYGTRHVAARHTLRASLPTPCGYCRIPVTQRDSWDAAHVIDGDASSGWMVAHSACNQRAKRYRGGR